jgi:hypothetical protein
MGLPVDASSRVAADEADGVMKTVRVRVKNCCLGGYMMMMMMCMELQSRKIIYYCGPHVPGTGWTYQCRMILSNSRQMINSLQMFSNKNT